MKLTKHLNQFGFSSYNDLKKHRNDEGITFFSPKGQIGLCLWKDIEFDSRPDEKSDYGLYYYLVNYDGDYNYCEIYHPIEDFYLDDIWGIEEVDEF